MDKCKSVEYAVSTLSGAGVYAAISTGIAYSKDYAKDRAALGGAAVGAVVGIFSRYAAGGSDTDFEHALESIHDSLFAGINLC